MANIGQSIPEFKVQAFHNGEFREVTHEDVKGKWSIFLFYPADFTFVCPTELEDMAKYYEELKGLGVEIQYPMLGDPTGVVTRGFGVMIEESGLAMRGTFLADPEGVIQVAEIHAGGIGRSAKDMVRKVKAAQYVATHDGEVCPAAWEEGEKTLAPSLDLVGKI